VTSILVVEDEKSLSEPLAYLLRREGYDVAVVDNGLSAVAAFTEDPTGSHVAGFDVAGAFGNGGLPPGEAHLFPSDHHVERERRRSGHCRGFGAGGR